MTELVNNLNEQLIQASNIIQKANNIKNQQPQQEIKPIQKETNSVSNAEKEIINILSQKQQKQKNIPSQQELTMNKNIQNKKQKKNIITIDKIQNFQSKEKNKGITQSQVNIKIQKQKQNNNYRDSLYQQQQMINLNTKNFNVQKYQYIKSQSQYSTHKSRNNSNQNRQQTLKKCLQTTFSNHKLIKRIFNHFCRDNYISSIKSSLFEQKYKIMQQMILNRWMIFCKQYQIVKKLIQNNNQNDQNLGSRIKQGIKMKLNKKYQNILINIFKQASKNKSIMVFQNFVEALSLLFKQFSRYCSQSTIGISSFLTQVLQCSQEKQCYQKLSNLKIQQGTPKIQYKKVVFTSSDSNKAFKNILNNQQKSKFYGKSSQSKLSLRQNKNILNLNKIISQAKRQIKQPSKLNLYSKKQNLHLLISKNSVKKQEQISTKPKVNKQLVKYFQSTQDDILTSYFQSQQQKNKK